MRVAVPDVGLRARTVDTATGEVVEARATVVGGHGIMAEGVKQGVLDILLKDWNMC